MVPGYLRRWYTEQDLSFDLPAICQVAGVRFVEARAEVVDPGQRVVTAGGTRLEFDLASLDVGADAAELDVPGVREHALPVRPVSSAIALGARVESLATGPPGTPVAACVVGGGAAGAEVAWALHRRLVEAGARPEVTLVERAARLLPELTGAARDRARALLDRRGIRVVLGRAAVAVDSDVVTLDSGERVASRLAVWLTGAAPNEVVRRSPLAKDARGYMLVDATLQEAAGAPVWGAGDCVTLAVAPDTPKAGVYAVREGPVLAANLRAACDGSARRRSYAPQPHFLALLDTADGRALLRWHGLTAHSRAAWQLKAWIDRRFVRRYQRLHAARAG